MRYSSLRTFVFPCLILLVLLVFFLPQKVSDQARSWTSPTSWVSDEDMQLARAVEDFAASYPDRWTFDQWNRARNDTQDYLFSLSICLKAGSCTQKQTSIVLAGSRHFGNARYGSTSGEDIWARSTMDAFEELGVSVVFAGETLEILDLYQLLSRFIITILADAQQIDRCAQHGISRQMQNDWVRDGVVEAPKPAGAVAKEPNHQWSEIWGWPSMVNDNLQDRPVCMKTEDYPEGIPLWMMHSFHFWPGPDHPLGRQWTLSPERYEDHPNGKNSEQNYYLGYSVEKYCKRNKYYPHSERDNQAFIYAKNVEYFGPKKFVFYNDDHTFSDIKANTGIKFVAAAGRATDEFPDPGVDNRGRQTVEGFYELIAKSNVLIGIGQPWLSPTPYDGLCLGLPFICPVNDYDKNNPQDRERWNAQSNAFHLTRPPYVYHVLAGDIKGFEEAIQTAMRNPIDSYIMPDMTIEANLERHRQFLEVDWRSRGIVQMQALMDKGQLNAKAYLP